MTMIKINFLRLDFSVMIKLKDFLEIGITFHVSYIEIIKRIQNSPFGTFPYEKLNYLSCRYDGFHP